MTPKHPLNNRLGELIKRVSQPSFCILGLMSGTSLDGLELALAQFSGHGSNTCWKLLKQLGVPYSKAQRNLIREVAFKPQAPLAKITTLNAQLGIQHARMILKTLQDWQIAPQQVDCIASHGQTIYHAPQSWKDNQKIRHASLQIVDGDHIALKTGIITISDFRQKAIAQGSEGAPLAPYAEALLFSASEPRLFINLGGIANYTWLPEKNSAQPPRYQDSGPANSLLDAAFRHYWPRNDLAWDHDGKLALQGTPHQGWLKMLCQHPYFAQSQQKSSGPEAFGEAFLQQHLSQSQKLKLSPADVLATLCLFTAHSLTQALRAENLPDQPLPLFVSGGGIHNQALMNNIRRQFQQHLPQLQWQDPQQLGVPSRAKEALLFAALANETLRGESLIPGLGKISFPC